MTEIGPAGNRSLTTYRDLEKIDRFIKEPSSAIITEFTTLIPIHMCI